MMKPPFPWFGGKRRVAPRVWEALGDVANYIEPFAGSLAVLLNRPTRHTGYVETVNDMDAYICNFWRAVQHDPSSVARYADNPVSECDLEARHIWLVIAWYAEHPELRCARCWLAEKEVVRET